MGSDVVPVPVAPPSLGPTPVAVPEPADCALALVAKDKPKNKLNATTEIFVVENTFNILCSFKFITR